MHFPVLTTAWKWHWPETSWLSNGCAEEFHRPLWNGCKRWSAILGSSRGRSNPALCVWGDCGEVVVWKACQHDVQPKNQGPLLVAQVWRSDSASQVLHKKSKLSWKFWCQFLSLKVIFWKACKKWNSLSILVGRNQDGFTFCRPIKEISSQTYFNKW